MGKHLPHAGIPCKLANVDGKQLSMGPPLQLRRRLSVALVVAAVLELLANAE